MLYKIESSGENLSAQMLHELRLAYPLVVLRGFRAPSREELVRLARSADRFELLEWSFGPVMEMREDPSSPNYLFSHEAVPFHWDGAFHKVPETLLFHCLEAPPSGSGGETLFANTRLILEEASEEKLLQWSQVQLSYKTAKLAHYGGEYRGPLLQQHPRNGERVLRFAEPVETKLNPVYMQTDGLPCDISCAEFLTEMRQLLYDPRYLYSHSWQNGDLLLADNHVLLHARRAFRANVPRWLRRVQIMGELN